MTLLQGQRPPVAWPTRPAIQQALRASAYASTSSSSSFVASDLACMKDVPRITGMTAVMVRLESDQRQPSTPAGSASLPARGYARAQSARSGNGRRGMRMRAAANGRFHRAVAARPAPWTPGLLDHFLRLSLHGWIAWVKAVQWCQQHSGVLTSSPSVPLASWRGLCSLMVV